MHVLNRSLMSDSVIPWTVAHQGPRSMGFSRQEYWSGLPCLPPGELPDPGIKLRSPALQAHSLPSGHHGSRDNVYWPALIVCDVLPYCVWCVIPMANLQGGCYSPHFTVEETEVSRGFLHSRSSAGNDMMQKPLFLLLAHPVFLIEFCFDFLEFSL